MSRGGVSPATVSRDSCRDGTCVSQSQHRYPSFERKREQGFFLETACRRTLDRDCARGRGRLDFRCSGRIISSSDTCLFPSSVVRLSCSSRAMSRGCGTRTGEGSDVSRAPELGGSFIGEGDVEEGMNPLASREGIGGSEGAGRFSSGGELLCGGSGCGEAEDRIL